MAVIVEYRDIPLDDLVISKGQVRTETPGRDIEELARSIDAQGLLQPIVVCESRESGKWEILTGQRRFLAHKQLKRDVISAAILDARVAESEAKAISITENLVRRRLSGRELKDGITFLYNHYGSVKDVVEVTGLPSGTVRDYVKYPRLLPELKKMVDDGTVDINVAVKAQDASNDEDGDPSRDVAMKLAREMATMSGPQHQRIAKERKEHPERSVDDVIENAKTGSRVTQVVATVTRDTHRALQRFARDEGTNQDEAAVTLIEEALTERGLLDGA